MSEPKPRAVVEPLALFLCLFVLVEANYPMLKPLSDLAIFAGLGLVLCFLTVPLHPRWKSSRFARASDLALAGAATLVFGYMVSQTEPLFEGLWLSGRSLGNRAGAETGLDYLVAFVGLVLVLEAARRTVGPALSLLSLTFLAYAFFGPHLPAWLFPHRGYDLERIASQTFLHSQGVLGIALRVMFTYVFLFVVFGALLEATGATAFIIQKARRLFGGTSGGPAKVAVLSSGLMGSLSGSAVANTATTGTFTIPLMRSAGFRPHAAAGIEAAASSGGALMPPVMGAGAYMMLEIVQPPVTYLEIVQAALLPAVLYYLSLFLTVHFAARGLPGEPSDGSAPEGEGALGALADEDSQGSAEGWIFFAGLGSLVAFLLLGFTVFRAVTLAMVVVLAASSFVPRTRLTISKLLSSLVRAARGGIALICAAACVGIVIGVVTLTGVGAKLPATILPLAQDNLFLALLLIMGSSIVLGMGLPSAVCYLLLATLIGPALGKLGVVPLAAHLFIFYFGLMSMVTPPVALAAYTAASIAGSGIMRTAVAAFRYALIGFVLPFLFVYRPELLMLSADGERASWLAIAASFLTVALALVPLAASISGFFRHPLGPATRIVLASGSFAMLFPGGAPLHAQLPLSPVNLVGAVVTVAVLAAGFRSASPPSR